MPALIAGAAVAGSSVISGLFGKSAAGQAASASRQAAALQEQMYQTTRGDLAPFRASGAGALPQLNALTYGDPAAVQAQLEATPGYQFTRTQGLKAIQANAAARGLGVSGAALKGAATYATGLADQTFEERYNDALKTASMGANAAALTGQQGTQAASAAGGFLNQAGVANAAGTMALPNALTSGLQSYLTYNALQGMTGTKGYPTPQGPQPMPLSGAVTSPMSTQYQQALAGNI